MSSSPLTLGADPDGTPNTGSTLLRGALAEAVERFPDVFGDLAVPDAARFKRELGEVLARFEARRVASERRVEVARLLAGHVPSRARLDDVPLAEAFARAAPAPAPTEVQGTAPPGWVASVVRGGRTFRGRELAGLADALEREHRATGAAAAALRWAAQRLSEPLDLRGERFVVLGAAAELAPTVALLAAGARVVWVDVRPPELPAASFAGTLVHCAGDLLREPAEVYAAVAREATEGPVHLGLFAYAPGGGRELLLTTAMNAIAATLPREAVRSVSMWVSPTTPGELAPDDRRARDLRRSGAPRWQRALARARVLRQDGDGVARSIVGLQGPTYLAAQYLAKIATAEAWAVDRAPTRVSANVAGITATRSLEHPLFQAGFLGASAFGIEIFEPDQTRVLATALMLHDLFAPDAGGADPTGGPAAQARRVSGQAIHGGVRSAPFVFEHTIRVAAVLGLAKRPSLLLRLRRGATSPPSTPR